jgi:hypothetical protein
MLAGQFASVCAGWSSAPGARMACCNRAEGACPSVSSDDCCAAGEQRRHASSFSVFVLCPTVVAIVADVDSPRPTLKTLERTTPRFPSPPDTYFLGSAFLI